MQKILNRISFRQKIILYSVAALVILGLAFLIFNWRQKDTPDYALSKIQTAMKKHDLITFRKFVDVKNLSEKSTDVILNKVFSVWHQHSATEKTFSQNPAEDAQNFPMHDLHLMLQKPVCSSLQRNIEEYVKTGTWNSKDAENYSEISIQQILNHVGIQQELFSYQNDEKISFDKETKTKNKAVAFVPITFQTKETNEKFLLRLVFEKSDSEKNFKLTHIENLDEFLNFGLSMQNILLKDYIATSESLSQKHDEAIMQAEKKINEILHTKKLKDTATREEIKTITKEILLPDWKSRLNELKEMTVPRAAQSLHRLRLRICRLEIQSTQNYADWLETKNGDTIRKVNEMLREIKTLKREEEFLTRQLRDVSHQVPEKIK